MKLFAIIPSILYYILFGLGLLIFHVIQWLNYNLGGYQAHHHSVKWMNWYLMMTTKVLGTTHYFEGKGNLQEGVPYIFVSNHQSMFDISPIEWYLTKFHPKFISKIELGKGIPSVSYNLQHGGSVLIDRKDPRQALPEIKKLGQYIEQYNRSAVIFPEGTRSRDGHLKKFHDTGIKTLLKYSPSAQIVPVTINNSWKLVKNGSFPLTLGVRFKVHVHQPIDPTGKDFDAIMDEIKNKIQSKLDS